MMKVDPALTEALRSREAMVTEKLQVLHDTTLSMVRSRGRLTDKEVAVFYAAGYGQCQLLEIILGLSQKCSATTQTILQKRLLMLLSNNLPGHNSKVTD